MDSISKLGALLGFFEPFYALAGIAREFLRFIEFF